MNISLDRTTTRSATSVVHPSYRPDIDGLRAVAVLSVVIYHAFPSILPGGLVGVDIFFVISGYLISLITYKSLEAGNFSVLGFYIRRINRIFPALAIVMIASLAFGWACLLPDEYEQLTKHVLAGAGFVANLVLWGEVGYFDTDAVFKPMLHLWSLGIEEQFYVAWPLLALTLYHRRLFPSAILLIGLLSFAYNIYATFYGAPPAAFYSPASRAWELCLGVGLAWVAVNHPSMLHRHTTFRSVIGCALIIVGLAIINAGESFPGWYALLPTVGAALIISAGPKAIINQLFLASRPMVWVGLISYPLYLWHWPLFSFARILGGPDMGFSVSIILIVLSILLAFLTYFLIEKRMRWGGFLPQKAVLLFSLMAAVAMSANAIRAQAGVPTRASIAYLSQSPTYIDKVTKSYLSPCPFSVGSYNSCYKSHGLNTPPKTIIIGDSHAGHLIAGLMEQIQAEAYILNGGCPPVYGVERYAKGSPMEWLGSTCMGINKARLDYAIKSPAKNIILSVIAGEYNSSRPSEKYRYARDTESTPFTSFRSGLISTMSSLVAAGKIVYLVGDNPSFPRDHFKPCQVPERPFSIRQIDDSNCSISRQTAVKQINNTIALYRAFEKKYPGKVHWFDVLSAVCDETFCPIRLNGRLLYRDVNHLSLYGSQLISTKILKQFPELMN